MNSPFSDGFFASRAWLGLGWRLTIIGLAVIGEAVMHTILVQSFGSTVFGNGSAVIQQVQHTVFRCIVAYAVFCVLFYGLKPPESTGNFASSQADAHIQPLWFAVHGLFLASVLGLSVALRANEGGALNLLLAAAWIACSIVAAGSLFPAMAPFAVWRRAASENRGVLYSAILPALATTAAIPASQSLWRPAARVTFSIVAVMLAPFIAYLRTDVATLSLGTDRFMVTIADVCSGLEGVGLMLIFCVAWLWFFRREYYFPRAFLIVPTALLLMFLLNSVRIAALVLIGDAGYPNVAIVGFHSQAGWIAFNAVALGVAAIARRSAWLNRKAVTAQVRPTADNPTAAYLLPLLAILAAGMIAHAVSAGFDYLYALRFFAGGAALVYFRRYYRGLRERCSPRAVAVGILVFVAWIFWDLCFDSKRPVPEALAASPPLMRDAWIMLRVLATTLTVPIAEELAYRGYVMRVLVSRDFEAVGYHAVRWPGLVAASLTFGVMHGAYWLPGIVAGFAYGALAIRRNSLGEAIVAHATSNALIAATVLIFGRWELW